nr:carbon starvation CstA 5TM domain-containing protein [Geotalea toluenoxydans]
MAYWYHFAIMFEAVFILSAVDAGTRVGRYLLQEMLAKVYPRFTDNTWTPGVIVTSLIFTSAWGYLVYTGDITTIWPLFGMSNQLLATCALIVGATMLIRLGRARYAWVAVVPGILMIPITMSAGYLNITRNFLPKADAPGRSLGYPHDPHVHRLHLGLPALVQTPPGQGTGGRCQRRFGGGKRRDPR